MEKFLTPFKDVLEIVGVLAAWVYGLWLWSNRRARQRNRVLEDRMKREIDGVGARVNGLEITVGQHETRLDSVESELGDSRRDRQELFRLVGEFKAEVSSLKETCDKNDAKNNQLLTAIQVDIGKLGTKVDILLSDRSKK